MSSMLTVLILLFTFYLQAKGQQSYGDLAQGKTAQQSTTVDPHLANRAISDRNDDCNNYWSHTRSEEFPWWKVDLGDSFLVKTVYVATRFGSNGYHGRYDVLVGVNVDDDIKAYNVCEAYKGTEQAHTVTCSPPTVGRMVAIRRNQVVRDSNGQLMPLCICRVRVYGKPDLAKGRYAWESSTKEGDQPTTAVANNAKTSCKNGHSSTLGNENEPKWYLNLTSQIRVDAVQVLIPRVPTSAGTWSIKLGNDPGVYDYTFATYTDDKLMVTVRNQDQTTQHYKYLCLSRRTSYLPTPLELCRVRVFDGMK